jgi:hypothetical protein
MHIRHVSLVGVIFIGVLFGKIYGGLSDQLLEIFKRLIQSDCNCAPYFCCSKWGYCGSTKAYCGEGCQAGPCINKPKKILDSFNVTSEIFECVFPDINMNIRNRRFQGLTKAMTQMKWTPINAVEGAIFLAHIAYETDGLQTLAEDCIKQYSKYSIKTNLYDFVSISFQLVIITNHRGVQFKLIQIENTMVVGCYNYLIHVITMKLEKFLD